MENHGQEKKTETVLEATPRKHRKHRQKPTLKQRMVVQRIVENKGNISKSMREVGYSPATAKNPSSLIESDGFQTLLEEDMPLKELLKTGKEGLQAWKPDSNDPEAKIPDFAVRHKYFETGLELHNKIKKGSTTVFPVQINVNEDRDRFK